MSGFSFVTHKMQDIDVSMCRTYTVDIAAGAHLILFWIYNCRFNFNTFSISCYRSFLVVVVVVFFHIYNSTQAGP